MRLSRLCMNVLGHRNSKTGQNRPNLAKTGFLGRCAGDVKVLEGHAFVVEAAVSLGGRELRPGLNVYRFANRIPLLFEVRCFTHDSTFPSPCSWPNNW